MDNQELINQFIRMVGQLAPQQGPQQDPQQRQRQPRQFGRTVIVLPGPASSQVPRGRMHNAMRSQNLERRVLMTAAMSAAQIRQNILTTFQGFGHMEHRFVIFVYSH